MGMVHLSLPIHHFVVLYRDEHMKRSRWCPYLNMPQSGLVIPSSSSPSLSPEEEVEEGKEDRVSSPERTIKKETPRSGTGNEAVKTPTPSSRLTDEVGQLRMKPSLPSPFHPTPNLLPLPISNRSS